MKKALLWGAALFVLFILIGCKPSEPPEPFTLNVSDIDDPGTGKTWGASLLNVHDISTSLATGMPSGSFGAGKVATFKFYHPLADQTPNFNKPFNTPGTYQIGLAKAELSGNYEAEDIYFYVDNNGNKKSLSFPYSGTLSFSAFETEEEP